MNPLLWLLLPVAAISGWIVAHISRKKIDVKSSSDLHKNYLQGLNYLLNEQPDKAIEALINAADDDHEVVDTQLVLGMLFLRRGEVDRAIRIHQNIIARPNLSDEQREAGMVALGNDYFKAGMLDRAENIFQKLVDNGSKDIRAYKKLQELYEREKDWQQAIEMSAHLTRLCGHDSKNNNSKRTAHYYCELAEVALDSTEYTQILDLLKKAFSHDSKCLRAMLMKGDIYRHQEQWKEAMQCYSSALENNSRFAQIVYERIYTLYKEKNDANTLIEFFLGEADKNIPSARVNLLRVLLENGKKQQAEDLLKDELSKKNASPVMVKHYLRVMQSRTEGEINNAFATLYRLLDSELSVFYSYKCSNCGFESRSLVWLCPSCMSWGCYKPGRYLDSTKNLSLDAK